jgi:hypothetical protein
MTEKTTKNECDFCEVQENLVGTNYFIALKYYPHYYMILCDRCVDKINSYINGEDVDDYWLPEDAKQCGYPEFPYIKLINLREKYTESEGLTWN